jgi:hypothetical protein
MSWEFDALRQSNSGIPSPIERNFPVDLTQEMIKAIEAGNRTIENLATRMDGIEAK